MLHFCNTNKRALNLIVRLDNKVEEFFLKFFVGVAFKIVTFKENVRESVFVLFRILTFIALLFYIL